MKHNMIDFQEFFAQQMDNPEFKNEWEKHEPEYQLEREMIKARIEKRMSQKELARKMKTTQAVISRIESHTVSPSINTVNRIALALGKKLEIRFVSQK